MGNKRKNGTLVVWAALVTNHKFGTHFAIQASNGKFLTRLGRWVPNGSNSIDMYATKEGTEAAARARGFVVIFD